MLSQGNSMINCDSNTIAEKIPTYVIRALGGGLQIYPEKRTQDINTFREQLNASPTVIATASQDEKVQRENKRTEKRKILNLLLKKNITRAIPFMMISQRKIRIIKL